MDESEKLRYRNEYQTTKEFRDIIPVTDDDIFRDLSIALIKKLPIESLHKLIKFKANDPFSVEGQYILNNPFGDEHQKELLGRLYREKLIRYEIEIFI